MITLKKKTFKKKLIQVLFYHKLCACGLLRNRPEKADYIKWKMKLCPKECLCAHHCRNPILAGGQSFSVIQSFRHFSVFSTHPSCHSSPITVSVQPSTQRDPSGSMDSGTHSRISHPGCVARSKHGVLLLTLLCSEGN